MHALANFMIEHKNIADEWIKKSNYLCFLSVENTQELINLAYKAKELNIEVTAFWEPDLDDQLTSIALAPRKATKELCKGLKLALKDI